MKMIKKSIILIIMSILTIALVPSSFARAEDSNGMPFTVEPVLPDNQNKDIQGYISINTKSDSINQDLEFIVKNNLSEEQTINILFTDAYTSPNGSIQYVEKDDENSSLLNENYKLSNHLKIHDKSIKLGPNETKKISIRLDASDMKGSLLGGIGFSKNIPQNLETQSGSFNIDNKMNIIIGVLINFGVEDEIKLNVGQPYLDPMPSYYAIRLPIELDSAVLLQNTEINYTVYKDGEDLFSGSITGGIAPYTKTNISIPFESSEIEKNKKYDIKGKILYNKDGKQQSYSFDKTFKYKDKVSAANITKSIGIPIEKGEEPTIWIVVLAIIVIVPVLYYLYKLKGRKKNHQEEDDKIK